MPKALNLAYLALCRWQPPATSENGVMRREALKAIEDETGIKGEVAHYNAIHRPAKG